VGDVRVPRLEEAEMIGEEEKSVRHVGFVAARGAQHQAAPHAEIRAEEHPVLVLHDQVVQALRIVPTDLRHPRRDVDPEVGMFGQGAVRVLEVLGETAEVHADERGAGVFGQHVVPLRQERLQARVSRVGEGPAGVDLQLVPPLVGGRQRLEERLRITGVDEHGQAQAAGGGPHGVQSRVVHRQVLLGVGGVRHAQPQCLGDLHAARAHRGGLGEHLCLALPEVRLARLLPLRVHTHEHPALVLAGRLEGLLESVAGRPAGEVHEPRDPRRREQIRGRVVVRGRGVHVDVDERWSLPVRRQALCRGHADCARGGGERNKK
jgi:hypothetical protein